MQRKGPSHEPRTLLICDLVRSTDIVRTEGDLQAAEITQAHDRLARDLVREHQGQEIDKADGFFLLFELSLNALLFSLAYHQGLRKLGKELGLPLQSRVGIHYGEVVLWENRPEDIDLGANKMNVEGIPKQTCARLSGLALPSQTLLTRTAFNMITSGLGDKERESLGLTIRFYGSYHFQGIQDSVEVYEAGDPGLAPLRRPSDTEKARSLSPQLDPRSIDLITQLEEKSTERDRLRAEGNDERAAILTREILNLRRELRAGSLKAGDRLCEDRFELVEEIGQGGHAVVWKAFDRQRLKAVAIKVLHTQHVHDQSMCDRFFRGARNMSKLDVGVVEIVIPKKIEEHLCYYVMELIGGGDFRDVCRTGVLSLKDRLSIIRQLAWSLDTIHSKGIVHRDIKPANILLREKSQEPLLTDFDLVFADDTTGGTRTQGMLGTFLYMSPEVMEDPQEAGPASDVYSLGMTAVFSLYGQDLPPIVLREGEEFVDRLLTTQPIKNVLRKAIAWEMSERWTSMKDFGEALKAAIDQGGAPKLPPQAIPRLEAGMHTAAIWRIDADRKGRFLVTGSHDKTVRVWDLERRQPARILRPPIGIGDEGKVYAVAMHPDGSQIAVGRVTHSTQLQGCVEIYDRRTGQFMQRVGGLPTVHHLAYSHDGKKLVVCLLSQGIRVFDVDSSESANARGVYADYYPKVSCGAGFCPSGRLATTCYDGIIRLYEPDEHHGYQVAQIKAPDNQFPYGIAFSPDGERLIVGYVDSPHADLFSVPDLQRIGRVEAEEISNLPRVAFSQDGSKFFAGGYWDAKELCPIFYWNTHDLSRKHRVNGPKSTVLTLRTLPEGRIAYGSASPPIWGILSPEEEDQDRYRDMRISIGNSSVADMRRIGDRFQIDASGETILFCFEQDGRRPALFSLPDFRLVTDPSSEYRRGLSPPRTSHPKLQIENWENEIKPRLNGAEISMKRHDKCRCLAISEDGETFVLGSDRRLRLFRPQESKEWSKPLPAPAWAVHITRDAEIVVAAFEDGTIRWYHVTQNDGLDGLMTFFPHSDGERWLLWTPHKGYWYAPPGSEGLFGWHVNQEGKEAIFHPAWHFGRRRHRKEVIERVLAARNEERAIQEVLSEDH